MALRGNTKIILKSMVIKVKFVKIVKNKRLKNFSWEVEEHIGVVLAKSNMKKYIKKKFNRLSNIYDNITITEFAKISQIKHRTSYMYLFRNEKLGFVSSYNVNKSTFYKLNDKGRKFLFLINKYNIIL